MASRLQKMREYWQATADTCEELIESLPQHSKAVFEYETKKDVIKPANDSILLPLESINERVCILVSDTNLPHSWAEAVVKLQVRDKPENITQSSWLDIQEACAQLYRDDFGLLKLIINHEWQLGDIFGCHPVVPLTRFDVMGLLLMLHHGDEVVAVNKQRIKILKSSGSLVVFSRSLSPARERVLLHELAINC